MFFLIQKQVMKFLKLKRDTSLFSRKVVRFDSPIILVMKIEKERGKLTVGNGRANAGENEEQGGEELCKISLARAQAERILKASNGEPGHVSEI